MSDSTQTQNGVGEADAAAREGSGVPSSLDFEGLGFSLTLPAKLPFRVLRGLAQNNDNEPGQVVSMLDDILGSEQAEKVWESDLSLEEGRDLVGELLALYGIGRGESAASPKS